MNNTTYFHPPFVTSVTNTFASVDTNLWLFGCAALWAVYTRYMDQTQVTDHQLTETSRFAAVRDLLQELKNDVRKLRRSVEMAKGGCAPVESQ